MISPNITNFLTANTFEVVDEFECFGDAVVELGRGDIGVGSVDQSQFLDVNIGEDVEYVGDACVDQP